MRIPRAAIVILILLNAVVLLGQLWPRQAPPFARTINVVALIGDIVVFAVWLGRRR